MDISEHVMPAYTGIDQHGSLKTLLPELRGHQAEGEPRVANGLAFSDRQGR
jgi:hypothetical protein